MTLATAVKQRAKWERDAKKLADSYALANDYKEAAEWYYAAHIHSLVRQDLEAAK